MKIPEMEQEIQKNPLVFQIIPFQLGIANSHILEQDLCQRQSMRSETSLGFYLTLWESFPKSISMRMMKKHDQNPLMEILQVLGMLSNVECQRVFLNCAF